VIVSIVLNIHEMFCEWVAIGKDGLSQLTSLQENFIVLIADWD
jgi:hypothetical protein